MSNLDWKDGCCEYNPTEKRAAWGDETPHARADFVVGSDGQWFLCRECAELPEFKKYRKRKPIIRKEST